MSLATPYAMFVIARDKNAEDIRRAANARLARSVRRSARPPRSDAPKAAPKRLAGLRRWWAAATRGTASRRVGHGW